MLSPRLFLKLKKNKSHSGQVFVLGCPSEQKCSIKSTELTELRSFGTSGMQQSLLRTSFDSVVASACWSSRISPPDRNRLSRVLKKTSSVAGRPLGPVELDGQGRPMSSLMYHEPHPMQVPLIYTHSTVQTYLICFDHFIDAKILLYYCQAVLWHIEWIK